MLRKNESEMKKIRVQIIFCLSIVLYGCTSTHVVTTWKTQHYPRVNYNNILIMGIIENENDSLRREIEKHFVADLEGLGYHAVSALDEFGPKGFANLEGEAAYIKLCKKGIDAVITIALIDKRKETSGKSHKTTGYPAKYYYNRIWNYKNIQTEFTGEYPATGDYFWETILFDLAALEPQSTIQTRSFNAADAERRSDELLRHVIQKMRKEKILKRHENKNAKQLKAF
jgi:hypothetical protein